MAWGSDVYRADFRQELVNRYVARRADLIMTDSAALIDRILDLGAASDRTLLVNWGVDLETFHPDSSGRARAAERLGLGPGPVILSPRSLSPIYNPATIVEAFDASGTAIPMRSWS